VTTIKRCFKLLMPTYSLLISPFILKNKLLRFTERSATNLFTDSD